MVLSSAGIGANWAMQNESMLNHLYVYLKYVTI